jgi:hypothetical protein
MRAAPVAATGLALLAIGLGTACRQREPPEAARARASAAFLQQQIQSLEALVAKAEKGELETEGQIAIGVSEEVVKGLFNASLPRDLVLAGRLTLRLESAEAIFRGNRSGLLMRARISSTRVPDAYARIELGGALKEFAFEEGRLVARPTLVHFSVLESSVGDLAADLVENLVKNNLQAIEAAVPPLVIPVSLEEAVKIDGLDEGPVTAKPGALPLAIKVALVLPVNQRLWVLLEASAGPWQALPAAESK